MARRVTKGKANPLPAREIPEGEERRAVARAVELREADGKASITGYAAVFNQETVIGGVWGWREQIAPGAFTDAIGRDDVMALFNHDRNIVLGRTTSKTLTLREDDIGLYYAIEPPDTVAAKDLRTLIQRGDITGSSFSFRVEDDDWDETPVKEGKLPLRTITHVELFDVSPVIFPAYPQTSVTARSRAQALAEAAVGADPSESRGWVRLARARMAVEEARRWRHAA